MFKKNLFCSTLVAVLAVGLLGINTVFAFTEPTSAAPQNNVLAPLNTGIAGQSKSGGLILNTGGAANGLIVQTGSVGIGTVAPGSLLHLLSKKNPLSGVSTWANYQLFLQNDDNLVGSGSGIAFGDTQTANNVGASIIFKRTGTLSQGELQFYTKQANTDGTPPVQAMVISNTGNIGIGQVNPQGKLEVDNNGRNYFVNRTISGYAWTRDGIGPDYILLHRAYPGGAALNDYRVQGKISAIRGSTGAWNRKWTVEVNTATAYQSTRGSIIAYNEGGRLVTLAYGGVKYIAVEIPTGSSVGQALFTGEAYVTDGELLRLVYGTEVTSVTDFTPSSDPVLINNQPIGGNQWATSGSNIYNTNSGNIGIGTSNPTGYGQAGAVLALGSVNGNAPELSFDSPPGGHKNILVNDSAGFYLYDNNVGAASLYVQNSTGSVGIGTAAPRGKLEIAGVGDQAMGLMVQANSNNYVFIAPQLYPGSYNNITGNGDAGMFYRPSGGFVIAPWENSTKGIRIDANGSVGIGISGPGAKLDVNGSIITRGSGVEGGQINLQDGDNNGAWNIDNYGGTGSETLRIFRDSGNNQVMALNIGTDGNVAVSHALCLGGVCNSSWPASAATYWSDQGGGVIKNTANGDGAVQISGKLGILKAGNDAFLSSQGGNVLQWRNWNDSAPNWGDGSYRFETVGGIFHGDLSVGGSSTFNVTTTNESYVNGWFRINGGGGMYWQTYGSGFNMTDANWIRTYGGAGIWANGATIGTNGSFSSGYGGTSGPSGGAIFAGNVGIGVTNPIKKLEVEGSIVSRANDNWASIQGSGLTGTAWNTNGVVGWASGGNAIYGISTDITSGWAGYFQGRLYAFGDFYAQSGSRRGNNSAYWDTTSDERLKKNINSLGQSLEKLLQLRGVSYEWKDESKPGVHMGFVAQDVEKVFPEWVSEGKDGMKSVNISGFEALVVESMREFKNKSDSLEKDVQLLKEQHAIDEQKIQELEKLIRSK